jgi:hypothetical protein
MEKRTVRQELRISGVLRIYIHIGKINEVEFGYLSLNKCKGAFRNSRAVI